MSSLMEMYLFYKLMDDCISDLSESGITGRMSRCINLLGAQLCARSLRCHLHLDHVNLSMWNRCSTLPYILRPDQLNDRKSMLFIVPLLKRTLFVTVKGGYTEIRGRMNRTAAS
jgi:hypothetical protein